VKIIFFDQDIKKDFGYCLDELDPLKRRGTIESFDLSEYRDTDDMVEKLKDADILVVGVSRLPNEVLERLPKVRFIQFLGVGASNFVDIGACMRRNIPVGTAADYGSNAVAEFALSLAMSLARKINRADRSVKEGRWDITGLLGKEIGASVFGVVGTGRIGSLVARKANALGVTTLAYDIHRNESLPLDCGTRYCSLDELFSTCDFVSLHLALTDMTRGMINSELLGLMKPSAYLVNTSRAETVDYGALYGLLRDGRIAGAALDVFPEEPVRDFSLCRLENVIATPHIAYFTDLSNRNLLKKSVESIVQFLDS